jgi:hypothetical protein
VAPPHPRPPAHRPPPDGVVDAELHAPHNLGRATPAAAFETFCWACNQNDLDAVGECISFTDGTAENRAAFMAGFSPAVRARYQTPERLCAAAFFGIGSNRPDPAVAVQIVSVTEDHGPDQVKIEHWWQTAAGKEAGGRSTFYRLADGWREKPLRLQDPALAKLAAARLDPATGDVVPFAAEKR